MEVIQFQPTDGVRMTNDKVSRSRRYKISRTRNVLINARDAMGELGGLPEDLMHIDLAVLREYTNIIELIAFLEAAQHPKGRPTLIYSRKAPECAPAE